MTGPVTERTITVLDCACLRCGHHWTAREGKPRVCSQCHSPWWDLPPDPNRAKRGEGKRRRGASIVDVLCVAAAMGGLTLAVRYVASMPSPYLFGGLACILMVGIGAVSLYVGATVPDETRGG